MTWIVIIAVAGIVASVIDKFLSHRSQMEALKIEHLNKEIELERLKQENYMLENEEMKVVLDRIKEDNKRLSIEKDSPWLIQDTHERQFKKTNE